MEPLTSSLVPGSFALYHLDSGLREQTFRRLRKGLGSPRRRRHHQSRGHAPRAQTVPLHLDRLGLRTSSAAA